MNELAQRAVAAAIHGDWTEAKSLNELILEIAVDDKDALCRLARACLELGKTTKALSIYKKVLSLDPYNTIAQKAVERLEKMREASVGTVKENGANHTNHIGHNLATSASAFLEEPGKTKTATLIHLGAVAVLTSLTIGDSVKLVPHAHRVSAETQDSEFIGRLPDDLSHRIITLTRAGNEYDAFVRSATSNQVRIFIREARRGQTVSDIPSFPITDKADYVAFTPPDLIHEERPSTQTFEEELAE